MANFDICQIMDDTGASCHIMYTSLFKTLQLNNKNLSPYVGSELYGFNSSQGVCGTSGHFRPRNGENDREN